MNHKLQNGDEFGTHKKLAGAGYGMRDWLAQRLTAVIMAVFTLVVLCGVFFGGGSGYQWWAGFMGNVVVKFFAFATFVALAFHAWIGMRDIWMDYVKPTGVRVVLQIGTIVWLLGCGLWALKILL